jgi:transposase
MTSNGSVMVAGAEGARRSAVIPTGEPGSEIAPQPPTPDPEVAAEATRRRYSEQYKLTILKKADACSQPGELGALLRREGLYSSQLATWRRQRAEGTLAALRGKKRGRKGEANAPLVVENKRLAKENQRLSRRLKRAELIIDIQKKVSEALGMPLETPELPPLTAGSRQRR